MSHFKCQIGGQGHHITKRFRMIKTTYRKAWLGNLLQVTNLAFDIFFILGHQTEKLLYIFLLLVLELPNTKTTYRKPWPANLFQMSNMTFDPCFKVKRCHHTKTAIYLIYSSLGLELTHNRYQILFYCVSEMVSLLLSQVSICECFNRDLSGTGIIIIYYY